MAVDVRSAVVVGLGKSGLAAARLLLSRGARVTVVDEKAQSPDAEALGRQGATLRLGGFPDRFWDGADVVVVSPGVPLARPELQAARAAGATVWGEVELAFRLLPPGAGPVLGITGTNGKSTTTALLGDLVKAGGLDAFVGGNLGLPFSEACARPYAVHVVELSSFQLEGAVSLACRGAAILNLTPDHLDRYADQEAYGEAKARIFRNQPSGGFAVVNGEDAHVLRLGARAAVPLYAFGHRDGVPGTAGQAVSEEGGFRLTFGDRERFSLRNRALRGRHNAENAMAAALLARLHGVSAADVQRGLDGFPGLAHRMEFVRELDGVEYLNDSKATNVDSSLVALRALPGRVWLIAGGKGKGAPYAPLVEAARGRVLGVLTVGKDAPVIAQAFAPEFPVHACETLDRALETARKLAKRGDTVLLSPACASYDQFDNFEHRGDTFKRLVRAL